MTDSCLASFICPIIPGDFSFQKYVAITPDYPNLRHSLLIVLVVVHFYLLRFAWHTVGTKVALYDWLFFSCVLLRWCSSVLLFSINPSPFPFCEERYSGSWWGGKRGILHLFLGLAVVSLNNRIGWKPSKVVVEITDIQGCVFFKFPSIRHKSLFLSMITTWIIFLTMIMKKQIKLLFWKWDRECNFEEN